MERLASLNAGRDTDLVHTAAWPLNLQRHARRHSGWAGHCHHLHARCSLWCLRHCRWHWRRRRSWYIDVRRRRLVVCWRRRTPALVHGLEGRRRTTIWSRGVAGRWRTIGRGRVPRRCSSGGGCEAGRRCTTRRSTLLRCVSGRRYTFHPFWDAGLRYTGRSGRGGLCHHDGLRHLGLLFRVGYLPTALEW